MAIDLSGTGSSGPQGASTGSTQKEQENVSNTSLISAKRVVPVLAIAAGFAAFFIFDLGQYLTLDALRDNREWLQQQVSANFVVAALTFIAIYAAAVAFSFPGATLMSLAGGLLFGAVFGTGIVVLSATIGATILFLVAKTALGDGLKKRAGPWVAKLQDGFKENELSYMLVLRLVPLFPFFVVNLVPALLGVSTRNFILATFFGIMPGTAVYVTVGAGLGAIFDSGNEPSLTGILSPELIAGLIGLAALSLVPVIYKKLQQKPSAKV